MPTFDAATAECRVFTFKDGVLSAVAHDLELAATSFTIEIEGATKVRATFAAGALRVLHAVRDGKPTDQLSAADRAKIEKTMRDEVLHAVRYPDIRLEAEATPRQDGFELSGTLTLCGQRRPVRARCEPRGDRMVAEATVNQVDFGIKPYTAMLGALKVRPEVSVRVSLPWPLPA